MKNFLLKEIVVWLLIFIGLVIFFVFTYIIATNKSNFLTSVTSYKTHLPESKGIYVGTKVTIHGANTGNVMKTTLLPDGQVEVRFSVRKKHAFAMTESSVVQIENAGALGDRFINIVTKDLSAPPLKKGALAPFVESSSFLSILTGKKDGSKSLQSIVVKIDEILGRLDKRGISGLLSPGQQEDLTQILKSGKNILKKVESGEGALGAIINDRSLYDRLLTLLGHRSKSGYLQDLSHRSSPSPKSSPSR